MRDDQSDACNYKIDAPYPPVRVNGTNSAYACAMLGNMADAVSEMSDVTRYFYVAVVAKPQYSWVSVCFHHISIIEMHHLNIIAELALLLGANPQLCNGQKWWSPSFIAYPREIRALIAESIKARRPPSVSIPGKRLPSVTQILWISYVVSYVTRNAISRFSGRCISRYKGCNRAA